MVKLQAPKGKYYTQIETDEQLKENNQFRIFSELMWLGINDKEENYRLADEEEKVAFEEEQIRILEEEMKEA